MTSLTKKNEESALKALGITARFVPVPVPLAEMKDLHARGTLSGGLGQYEQLKYYGAALVEYDRVVVMDADTMVLGHIDELFDSQHDVSLIGVYDHEMDIQSSLFPPVNSGFMVFTPDMADFDNLVEIYRSGQIGGDGWCHSGTGWTYGTGAPGPRSHHRLQQGGAPKGRRLSLVELDAAAGGLALFAGGPFGLQCGLDTRSA